MTQEKKMKKVFRSPSSGVECNAAQYLAEIMLLRKAERENRGSLAYKFWNKSHKKSYQAQIVAVNRLIKEFDCSIILAFINSDKGKKIYSFGYYHPTPFVKELIQEFARTYKPFEAKPIAEVPKIDTAQKPKPAFGKGNNLFKKLQQVENKIGKN